MAKKTYYILASLLLSNLFLGQAFSCVKTDEYVKAEIFINGFVKYEYEKCTESVGNYNYWVAVAKCTKEGGGKNIAGGCQHVVGHTYDPNRKRASGAHCEILKKTKEDYLELLNKYVSEKGIKKCKE
ncbi:MAG: hypothetical protein ABW092_09570 [Candidatus Thiodiazotropha sp.]